MDVLDLSLGEKKSRRKTQAPQRRHTISNNLKDDDSVETDSTIHQDDDVDSQKEEEESLEQNDQLKIDLNTSKTFLNPTLTPEAQSARDGASLIVSPYSSNSDVENAESRRPEQELGKSPSPSGSSNASHAIALGQPPINFLANDNNNNNNSNNLSFAHFQHLNALANSSQAFDRNLESVREIPNMTNFRDRLSGLASSMANSFVRPNTKKPASSIPFSSFDVQPIDTPGIPERTKKQNRWAFNVWREWARKRNVAADSSPGNVGKVPLDVGKATEVELDFWLAKFVQEIRRKDGNPYPPHTLMQIVMGIQRYLRQQAGRPSICILDRSNPTYGRFRSVLDSRIKELTSEGVAAPHKSNRRSNLSGSSLSNSPTTSYSASAANYPDQAVLWNAGIIGDESALSLLNAVFYHNTVTFGIRNIDDHWNLKVSHFVLGNRGQQGQAYVEFVPSRDPSFVNRSVSKDRRIYADPGNPRCVVKIFQKYISLVPPDGPFYRHPQEPTLVDRSIRFSDQWVGKNRLRAMIKHVFDSTRLDGRERNQGLANVGTNSQNSEKSPANQNLPNNDSNMNVYDRLAQVMWQISYMRSSPQIPTPANANPSPTIPNTPSPKPESTGYEASPPENPLAQIVPRRNEIILKRESSPDSLLDAPQPKQFRPFPRAPSKVEINAKEDSDDVKVTSSCEKQIDENALEIAVPRNIESIIVVKGTKKYTVQLE